MILDLVLPGIDGFRVLDLVEQRWPDLPILILSGHGRARSIVEAMRLGAADFLRKPFEVEEMDDTLKAILRSARTNSYLPDLRRYWTRGGSILGLDHG